MQSRVNLRVRIVLALAALAAVTACGAGGGGGGGGDTGPQTVTVNGRVVRDADNTGIGGVFVTAGLAARQAAEPLVTGSDGLFELDVEDVSSGDEIQLVLTFPAGVFTGLARIDVLAPVSRQDVRFITEGGATITLPLRVQSGDGPQPALRVTPQQFSAEADQEVILDAVVANVDTPSLLFQLIPPAELLPATEGDAARARQGDGDGGDGDDVDDPPTDVELFFGTLSATGTFTCATDAEPGLRGSILVTEETSGLSVEVPVLIVPPVLDVFVTPAETSLLAGQTATFEANAFDFFGEQISPILVDWRVTGGVGDIDRNGVLTATDSGDGQVVARVGLADPPGTADVTVVGSITGLSIAPLGNPVEIEAGTTRQFRAFVNDAAGNQTQVPATWSVDPATVGEIDTQTGIFTAGEAGEEGTVTAAAQGQQASVPVRIVELITPPSDQPRNVYGVVQDRDGPVAGQVVTVYRQPDEPDQEETVAGETTTDATGRYQFFLPVGTYRLEAVRGGAVAERRGIQLLSQDIRFEVNLTLVAQ